MKLQTFTLFAITLLLMACNSPIKNDSKNPIVDGDLVEYYDSKHIVTINYNDYSVTIDSPSASGIEVNIQEGDNTITSTLEGVEIRLTGETANGRFKLYSQYKCKVSLEGVTIHNPIGAAINIQSGKRIFIVLKEGTINNLSDGAAYTLEGTESMKGTFFSEGQLIFSGEGTLNVEGNFRHAIASDDYIRIRSGNINVTKVVRDAIHTKDYFIGDGGVVKLIAGDDGIVVSYGYIHINGGTYSITSEDKGIIASYDSLLNTTGDLIDSQVLIKGGNIKIITIGERSHDIESPS